MARDPRFVAVHRGGLLDLTRHRLLAGWAAVCAEHVLPLFAQSTPEDDRPRRAIAAAGAWSRGEISVGAAREAALQAHAAAREAPDAAASAAARAAGHAVATAHMADHALGPVYYAVKAVKAAAAPGDAEAAGAAEHQWQRAHLPAPIRELVESALAEGTVLGKWRP
ncbi:putative immunity protein [Caldilinea sp.]|uniref:putative immunity protein n=1 Tax=Caldilinea sp. TaxID=2293560 RepID=UPI002BC994A2|nr:hypothetical protein [Anaerolineales bacterium]HQY91518.1 hypothetical protein [Caldilinea sp.]HRA65444.1 hypothetical protein [Caldilinea sp.]